MIYSHKPQRSGRSISTNTNNPPQDPPPPKLITPEISIPDLQIPDIFINDTTPPVPEICIPEKPEITTPKIPAKKVTPKIPAKKVTPKIPVVPTIKKTLWWRKLVSKILFWRKK